MSRPAAAGLAGQERTTPTKSWVQRAVPYALSIAAVALATFGSVLAERNGLDKLEFPLFLLAVASTIWYPGVGPAVLTVVLSTLSFNYYFIEPRYTLWIDCERSALLRDVRRLLIGAHGLQHRPAQQRESAPGVPRTTPRRGRRTEGARGANPGAQRAARGEVDRPRGAQRRAGGVRVLGLARSARAAAPHGRVRGAAAAERERGARRQEPAVPGDGPRSGRADGPPHRRSPGLLAGRSSRDAGDDRQPRAPDEGGPRGAAARDRLAERDLDRRRAARRPRRPLDVEAGPRQPRRQRAQVHPPPRAVQESRSARSPTGSAGWWCS